ncbi:MAG: glycosyltransferase family 4 protein, partial [Bacteroidia bacterium]|nr:glycosyltransferase family 4 protein [Bacteroidia bacterium]
MPEKQLLFYSTPSLSTFVKKDIDILKSKYNVRVFVFNPQRKILTPFFFLKQIWALLINFSAFTYVTQFGGYHSLLPGVFALITGRKSFIVTGGTDCVSFPKMNYGNFAKFVLGKFTCISYHLASRILPVHESLVSTLNDYDPEQSGAQGMLAHCKNLNTPYTVIHNGSDVDDWERKSGKVPGTFITVAAGAADSKRFKLKGLDLICDIAPKFPQCTFTIVGCTQFNFKIELPENVHLIGFADQTNLIKLFSSHAYYMQLSISEGFPKAICEAMLCECIPIGSNVGALPDIIGEAGLILNERKLNRLQEIVEKSLNFPVEKGI